MFLIVACFLALLVAGLRPLWDRARLWAKKLVLENLNLFYCCLMFSFVYLLVI